MSELVFTSRLAPEHKAELERLLFFNGNQAKVVDGVAHIARRYGIPRIHTVDDRLRVVLGGELELQALYVLDRSGAPIGVMAYTREHDTLMALFVAIDEEHTSGGSKGGRMLLVKMLRELQCIARRVRGVVALEVFLGRPEPTRITVARLGAAEQKR
ncbi:MAG: hypothetical protein IAG13_28220 [Deltaproteobacteria bacterium]|nr:hypothetical protein [Nannocystaceae bacterium]